MYVLVVRSTHEAFRNKKLFLILHRSFTEQKAYAKMIKFYNLKLPRLILKLRNQFLDVWQLTFRDFGILTSQSVISTISCVVKRADVTGTVSGRLRSSAPHVDVIFRLKSNLWQSCDFDYGVTFFHVSSCHMYNFECLYLSCFLKIC